ncbi:hypothetical protein B0H12DRAFT_782717 [Mycena haematopus]|nr:hypothetical protein B0H12DRAFT_782717 [Mycena haematopus]
MDPGTVPPIVQVSGPLIIGYMLDAVLLGALSIQLYMYYQAFPKDRHFTKSLVYTVYIIELAATIFIMHDAFAIFGYGFSDMSVLAKVHFDWLTAPIMTGIVAAIGQCFYAYRVHVLSRGRIFPCLIIALSFTSSIGAFITGAWTFEAGDIRLLQNHRISVAIGVWCGASAVCDIMIAVCMTHCLTRNDSGFRQTRELVSRLTRLIIETGSLTAAVALVDLILFLVFRQRLYYAVGALIMPKLYANSMLVVLNSRIKIMGGRGVDISSEIISEPIRFNLTTRGGTQSSVVAISREGFSNSNLDNRVETKGSCGHDAI